VELGHIAGWLVGSTLLAAGALLLGYSLGLRAGVQKSNLAKDLRISAQEQRIGRLEKSLTVGPSPVHHKIQSGSRFNRVTETRPR
jgi:hypothetical protein